jgi:hypothetical protein
LNEGVRPFHDVRQQIALRERVRDSTLERLIELAQGMLGKDLASGLAHCTEHSGDLAALVAHR